MEYIFLKGFLVLFLIHYCTSDDLPTSIQPTAPLEDAFTSPPEPEQLPDEVVPVVAPPSLEEVHQAVQEASEKAEGGAAEELLKELLERVVEAALGQVEGKRGDPADNAADAEEGRETDAELSEQVVVGMDVGGEEESETKEEDWEKVADIKEKMPASVETTGTEAGGSIGAQVGQGHFTEALKETGADLAFDGKTDDSNKQVVILEGKVQTETTPSIQEIEEGVEPKHISASDLSLGADTKQIETVWEGEDSLEEEAQVDGLESEVRTLTSDNHHTEATQTAMEESFMAEENKTVNESDNDHVEEEAIDDIGIVGAETNFERGEIEEDTIMETESELLLNGGADQQAAEEDNTSQTSNYSQTEDLETLLMSTPEAEHDAEAAIEQSSENQTANMSPFISEDGENVFTVEESDHINEILTPTNDLLAQDSNVAHPTLDYFVRDDLVIHPQARGEESGEANDLEEDSAGKKEMGLEAWKICAIITAVFLVLETAIIAIYILKCRNKNSSLARQRSCEEGSVEPEATTAGDCSDDTLPAVNGDTQQILAINQCDVATTVAQNTELHKGEHVMNMSNLPDSSTEESANIGPGPDSLLRTSML